MSVRDAPARRRRRAKLAAGTIGLIMVGLLIWVAINMVRERDPTRAITLGAIIKPGAAAGFNLLLITLDTTRADHLPCYGYGNLETPSIDSLLAHGVRFDHAVTSAAVTLPAHATILTGLYPYHHGVRNNGAYRLPEKYVTLAEMLQSRGYATAAFVASFVLDKRFGLDQGFDVYDFEVSDKGRRGPQSLMHERGADRVTSAALRWLRERRSTDAGHPLFMWVHYYDPHAPYESPLEEASGSGDRSRIRAYDAEIALVDLHLRRLLSKFEELNLANRTLTVVVSDHGEALGDHGEEEHGGFIYEPSMHAALIISSPALFAQPYRVDDRVVGTVDIVPTVAELLNVPGPVPVDGRSLLTPAADAQRAVYLETKYTQELLGCAPLYGLRRLNDKFIRAPRPEYYDLRRDPEELHNRYADDDAQVRALERRLAEIMSAWPEETGASRTMTSQEIERLASLGYVDLSQPDQPEILPDPKDQVPLLAEIGVARDMLARGQPEEALVKLRKLAGQMEGAEAPLFALADAYVQTGRREEAVQVLSEFAAEHRSARVLVRLAAELLILERYDEMERALQAAEMMDPLTGLIPVLRGDRFFNEGAYRSAIEEYEKAIEMDGERLGPRVRERLREARRLAP